MKPLGGEIDDDVMSAWLVEESDTFLEELSKQNEKLSKIKPPLTQGLLNHAQKQKRIS